MAFDREHVDDLLRVAGEARREVLGAGGIGSVVDLAGQHDVVVHRGDLDGGTAHVGAHHRLQIGDIALDADVDRQNLMARAVEEEGVGLAGLLRQQEDAARRAHHRIDDFRIGDQHVARIGIELHHRGLVERQRDAAVDGAAVAARSR